MLWARPCRHPPAAAATAAACHSVLHAQVAQLPSGINQADMRLHVNRTNSNPAAQLPARPNLLASRQPCRSRPQEEGRHPRDTLTCAVMLAC